MVSTPGASVLTDAPFDSFAGLPLHPLVVHLVVVILPLAALLLIFVILVKRWRRPFDLIAVAGLVIGAAGALLAKETGESLASQVGQPQQHADWGSILVYLAALLLVVAALWVWLQRRRTAEGPSILVAVVAAAAVLLSIATIVMTALVGHTGAEAVWGRVLAGTTATTSSPEPTSTAGTQITMADVAQHSTEADCWSAVAGNAYDLTTWIAQHPGGQQAILGMCGVDSTDAFASQHGGQSEPEQELANFLIGPISG